MWPEIRQKSFVFLSLPVPLKDSVLVMQAIRVSFGHNLLSARKDGNTNGVNGWEALDCLDMVLGCTPSGRIFRSHRSWPRQAIGS